MNWKSLENKWLNSISGVASIELIEKYYPNLEIEKIRDLAVQFIFHSDILNFDIYEEEYYKAKSQVESNEDLFGYLSNSEFLEFVSRRMLLNYDKDGKLKIYLEKKIGVTDESN